MSDQYVYFPKGGGQCKVYVRPSEKALKDLEASGTVLKNPDLDKVRNLHHSEWRLRGKRVKPRFRLPLQINIDTINFTLLFFLAGMKLYEMYLEGWFK